MPDHISHHLIIQMLQQLTTELQTVNTKLQTVDADLQAMKQTLAAPERRCSAVEVHARDRSHTETATNSTLFGSGSDDNFRRQAHGRFQRARGGGAREPKTHSHPAATLKTEAVASPLTSCNNAARVCSLACTLLM